MLISLFVSAAMIVITIAIHYGALRTISILLTAYCKPGEKMIFLAICGVFLAHIVEIASYAGAFYWLEHFIGAGDLTGSVPDDFMGYFYYSIVMYTSLGIGDVVPSEHLRIMSGLETLNGLILIGWSTSFTFMMMRRFWFFDKKYQST